MRALALLKDRYHMKVIALISLVIILTACSDGTIIGANKLFNKGEYAAAISKALHAESKYKYTPLQQAELDYIVAESYAKLNEVEKSVAMYKHIVKNYPETKFALLSKTVLEKIHP